MSGRFAAAAVTAATSNARDPAPGYERAVKRCVWRCACVETPLKLMTFLERKSGRFDLLFRQLEGAPRSPELLVARAATDFYAAAMARPVRAGRPVRPARRLRAIVDPD